MKRIQAFEWHDLPATPGFMKNSIVEILGMSLRHSRVFPALIPTFTEFLERAECDTVLDMCSGSGRPVSILLSAMKKQGIKPPGVILSDLYPDIAAMSQAKKNHDDIIRIWKESVDATRVPEKIDCQACTIFNAFHHFPPELAAGILSDCVARKQPIFIMEAWPRDLRRMPSLYFNMIAAAAANPFIAPKNRLLKFGFSYLIPAIFAIGVWDSIVSLMRTYEQQELEELASPFTDNFVWEYRSVPFFPGGRAVVFMGFPL